MKPAITLLALVTLAAPVAAQQFVYQPDPSLYRNDKAEGTFKGGAFGAFAGALLGSRGNRGEAALIGAGIGALTGRVLGAQQDAADRQRAATGFNLAAQANTRAQQLAVTNADLIQLTSAGLSEDVIIGAIRNRGGRFDLSPQGLIALKQAGVSDRVVAAAQSLTNADGVQPTTVFGPGAGRTVLVRPTSAVRVGVGYGYGGFGPRISYGGGFCR